MILGKSESFEYQTHYKKRCKDDKDREYCLKSKYDSIEQCISQAKIKCNLEASCFGVVHRDYTHSQTFGEVEYCHSSELDSKNGYNSYMKSGPGICQFYKTFSKNRNISTCREQCQIGY